MNPYEPPIDQEPMLIDRLEKLEAEVARITDGVSRESSSFASFFSLLLICALFMALGAVAMLLR